MDDRPQKNQVLYEILYVVFKRKFALLILCAMSFALILFFSFLTKPAYRATARILIRSNPQQQLILFKDLATPGREVATGKPATNLVHILTSQETARQVVETFSLDERMRKRIEEPERLRDVIKTYLLKPITYPIALIQDVRGAEKRPTDYLAKAMDYLIEEAEDIRLLEESSVIKLCIWEETPKLSSDIANYMAQLLIDKTTELEQSNANQAYEFTKSQVKEAEKALAESETELLQFRKSNGIVNLGEQMKAKLDELNRVEGEYINVKAEFSEAQARLEEMRNKISAQKKLLSNSPIHADNPVVKELVNSLNSREIQLAGELEKFTESSTNVKKLRAQTSESREKIEEELKAIMRSDSAILHTIHPDLPNEYAQLTSNLAGLAAKKDVLHKEMDALKVEGFSLSVLETELDRLSRRKETNEKLYANLLDKFSELQVQKVSQMSGYDLKVIDKAFIPEDARPDRPKWLLVILLGFMSSILISLSTVFFIEYWDESFKSPNEIEDQLGLSVLCTIPEIK